MESSNRETAVLNQDVIQVEGGEIEILFYTETDGKKTIFIVMVDDIPWVIDENPIHVSILYSMMRDHFTEYMNYFITDP